MKLWAKMLVGTAVGCGLYITAYARKMNKIKAELLVIPKVILHSITFNGIVLRVDVTFKNPNAGHFTIRFPFITVLFKGAVIGSSKLVNQEIVIPQYGEKTIEEIMITIPLDSLFSVVTALVKSIKSKESVTVTVRTKTTVNLVIKKVDIIDEQDVPLRQQQAIK